MSRYYRDPVTGEEIPIDGMRSIQDMKNLMLEICYPIGSIYISTNNESPATFLGGTWIQHSGYMLRGASSDVHANHTGNDGGADSVTVSSVASHNHSQNGHQHFMIGNTSSSDHNYASPNRSMAAACWDGNNNNQYYLSLTSVGAGAGLTSQTTATNKDSGANYTVQTLPKYKNVYIWERTA